MMLERRGESMTVTTFTQSGTDEYGDATYDETVTTVQAFIEQRGIAAEPIRNTSGEVIDTDVSIFVSDSVNVNEPAEDSKASIIERDSTGKKYRVQYAFIEGNGIIKCDCTQMR